MMKTAVFATASSACLPHKKNWNQTVPIFQPVSKNKITHSFSASLSAPVVAGIVLGHMCQMGKSLPMQQYAEDGEGEAPSSA